MVLYIETEIFFFTKTKRYSFIQIERVHQIQTSLKTQRVNLRTNSQHPS